MQTGAFFCLCEPPLYSGAFHKNFLPSAVAKIASLALLRRKGGSHHPAPVGAKGGEKMKDSYEQRIQNQFGAFCVKVLKNEARHIQREYARLRDQEKSLGELTASELEQTAVWDKHFMDEYVFDVQGLPVVVNGNILADALAQLPEGKRDVILLSYFLGMTDREISEKLNIVHQTVSKRRRATLKELREYLVKEGFEWPDE